MQLTGRQLQWTVVGLLGTMAIAGFIGFNLISALATVAAGVVLLVYRNEPLGDQPTAQPWIGTVAGIALIIAGIARTAGQLMGWS